MPCTVALIGYSPRMLGSTYSKHCAVPSMPRWALPGSTPKCWKRSLEHFLRLGIPSRRAPGSRGFRSSFVTVELSLWICQREHGLGRAMKAQWPRPTTIGFQSSEISGLELSLVLPTRPTLAIFQGGVHRYGTDMAGAEVHLVMNRAMRCASRSEHGLRKAAVPMAV